MLATRSKRFLAMLLALIMCLSTLPIGVFATERSSSEQIMSGYYVPDDTSKTVTTDTTTTAERSTEGENVKVSKTIEGTENENEFLVTLEVQTKQKLSETVSSPDAAVVLVLDRSGSMNSCADCGGYTDFFGYYHHNYGCERDWANNTVDYEDSRMAAAKAGAIAFVDQLLEDTPKDESGKYTAHRYVSLVSFASKTKLNQDWVDVTTEAGYDAFENAINSQDLYANGGTYLQGGLKLAVQQLSKTNAWIGGEQVDITAMANRFTVLLTDGVPTISENYGKGYASDCCEELCDETAATADELRELGPLYSICYGADGDTCYEETQYLCKNCGKTKDEHIKVEKRHDYRYYCDENYSKTYSKGNEITSILTAGQFLRRISTNYFSADNADDLNTAFGDISDLIALLTEAWKVTDPMGEYIKFGEIRTSQGEAVADCPDDVLVWDLKSDVPSTSGTDTEKTYTYTLQYTITLNTLKGGYTAGDEYATNGYTYLTYVFYNGDGQMVDEDGKVLEETPEEPFSISFNVPAVHGYADDLSFTKQAYHNDNLKLASSFKLAHSAACDCGFGAWNDTADSVANVGTVSFEDIPSGHTYTLTETDAQDGYVKETKSYTVQVAWGEVTVTDADDTFTGDTGDNGVFLNKLDPQNTSFTITKTWAGGMSVSSISVDVYRLNGVRDDAEGRPGNDPDDRVVDTVTITGSGDTWTGTTNSLPTVDQETGDAITYYVKEQDVSGYEATYGGNQNDGFTITNTKVETGDITVKKVWNAPESYYQNLAVVVNVYQNNNNEPWKENVTLNAANDWTVTYEDVPTQVGGVAVTYRVEEKSVGGVVVADDGTVTVGNHVYTVETSGTTVTNTLQTQNETVTFTGTKTWKDNDNAYGTRPDSITIQVMNGNEVAGSTVIGKQTDGSYNWSYSITVPKFDSAYNEIDYDVVEVVEDSNYISTETDTGFTNTLTATMDIDVEKVWDVPEGFFGTTEVEGQDGSTETINKSNPDVTVELWRTAAGETEEVDEAILTADALSNTFEDVAVYNKNGVQYLYFVLEQDGKGNAYNGGAIEIDGQKMSVAITGDAANGFTVTNSAMGETSVTVNKVWVDGSNISGTRPEMIYISLFADGALERTMPVTSANAAADNSNLWTYTFEGLAAYDGDTAIEYTVAETDASGNVITTLAAAVEGDSYNVTQNGNTITNTLAQRTDVSVSINKTWVDGDNKWNTRPVSVTFDILADGASTGKTLTVGANSSLTVSLGGLDRYNASGAPINYTLQEQTNSDGKVEGNNGAIYTPGDVNSTDGYNFTATNTLEIPTIDLPVSKTWIDGNKNHGNDSVTAVLVVNGVADENRTVELKPGYGWKGVFEDLPKYSDDYQTQYTYSVQELNVPEGYTVSYNGGQIINTMDDPVDVELTITKTWVGPEANRPNYVTVGIFRSSQGSEPQYVTGADVYLTAPTEEGANQSVWAATSAKLDRYDDQGYLYTYSIRELDEGTNKWVGNGGTVTLSNLVYDVKISGFQITNTVQQDNTKTVSGTKTWANVSEDQTLPSSIQVMLWADGGFVSMPGVENPATVRPDSEGKWTYSFEGLPRYAVGYGGDGHEIVYTVTEYGADTNGDIVLGDDHFKVTNTDGTYDLVNTYESTDHYYYKVVAVYHTYYEETGNTDTNSVDVVTVTEGTKGSTYTFDPQDYVSYNNRTYTFDEDNAGNTSPSVTLEKANEVYTVYFHYDYTVKDSGGGGGSSHDYYKVTVNYYDEDGNVIHSKFVSSSIREGRSWDFSDKQLETITVGDVTYTFSYADGDPITGTNIRRDQVVDLYYTSDADIDDGDTPLGPGPDDGGETDIDDGDTPLGPNPDDGTEIVDPDTPMGNLPQTGAAEAVNPYMTAGLIALSAAMAAVGLTLTRTKHGKREED